MNRNLKIKLQKAIEERLESLLVEDELGKPAKAIVELDQQTVGRLSRVDALQNQYMAKATDNRRKMERERLKAALKRLHTDEYGYCLECGEMISTKRLELNPATPLCIECAQS